jgi:hypothetical protein
MGLTRAAAPRALRALWLVLAVAPRSALAQGAPSVVNANPDKPTPTAAPAAPAAPLLLDGLPPPSARIKTLLGGLGMFGLSYGGMALMGALWEGVPGADFLYAPVVGPWIGLGESGCAPGEESAEGEGCTGMLALRGILYTVDGLLQLGGLGLVATSIFMETGEEPAQKVTILPAPFVVRDAVGLGLVGSF